MTADVLRDVTSPPPHPLSEPTPLVLAGMTREDQRALLTSDRKKQHLSARLNSVEADKVSDLLHTQDDGYLLPRADLGDEELSPTLVRLFDRGWLSPHHTTDKRTLRWTFPDEATKRDAVRALVEVRRAGQVGSMAPFFASYRAEVPLGICLAALMWHYKDTSTTSLSIEPLDENHQVRVIEHPTATEQPQSRTLRVGSPNGAHAEFQDIRSAMQDQVGPNEPMVRQFTDPTLGWVITTLRASLPAACVEDLPDEAGSPVLDAGLAVTINLDTWRIRTGTQVSTRFTDRLPHVTRLALHTLGADDLLATIDATDDDRAAETLLREWAEEGLTVTTPCGGTPAGAAGGGAASRKTTGSKRHTVHVNPITGDATTIAKTTKDREHVEATHMLWALSGVEPNGCQRVATFLTWLGPLKQITEMNLATSLLAEQVFAVRTALRTIEYLDAGLDLPAHAGWLQLGAEVRLVETVEGLFNDGSLDPIAAWDALREEVRALSEPLTQEEGLQFVEVMVRNQEAHVAVLDLIRSQPGVPVTSARIAEVLRRSDAYGFGDAGLLTNLGVADEFMVMDAVRSMSRVAPDAWAEIVWQNATSQDPHGWVFRPNG